MHILAYSHHGSMGTYIAHVIIRGIIYKTIFAIPFPLLIVIGLGAVLYIKRGKVSK